jgi:DNA-binding FadR family transcriptional regulator
MNDLYNVLQPIRGKRLSEDVCLQLKEAIYSGKFMPEERLPSQKELSSFFRVGGPVIREAMRNLESLGLVTVRRGAKGGVFVRKIGLKTLLDSFEGIAKLDSVPLENIIEAQIAVEIGILPLIIQNIQPEDYAAIEANIKEAQEGLEKGIKRPLNVKFHVILARASHNILLSKIMEALLELVVRFLQKHEYSYERKKNAIEAHRKILQFLRDKEEGELERYLVEYLNNRMKEFTAMKIPSELSTP